MASSRALDANPPKENKNPSEPEPKKEPPKDNPDKEATATPPAEPRNARSLPVTAAIDREMNKRLAEAKVPASPQADDAEFLRRVTLDLTGRIPTYERDRRLPRQQGPRQAAQADRRAAGQPGVRPALRAPSGATCSSPAICPTAREDRRRLRAWLAEQFNGNRGWDAIVRDLLTAEGELAAEPADRLPAGQQRERPAAGRPAGRRRARLFLGVQLQCAECHNHPFAHWKQTDFWGMAAFFGKVRNTRQQGPGRVALTETPTRTTASREGPSGRPDGARRRHRDPRLASGKAAGKVVKARFLGGDEPTLDDDGAVPPALAAWVTARTTPTSPAPLSTGCGRTSSAAASSTPWTTSTTTTRRRTRSCSSTGRRVRGLGLRPQAPGPLHLQQQGLPAHQPAAAGQRGRHRSCSATWPSRC